MKKTKFLLIAAFVLVLGSCVKASEKASGNYTGSYNIVSVYSGTTNIVASGDAVNMTLSIPSISLSGLANGVTVTLSGENVSFTYSNPSTTDGAVTALSGTLTGSSIAFSFTVVIFGSPAAGTFTGTK